MDDWNPPIELSSEETAILNLCKKQKLWGFLRRNRHELLNQSVREALRRMYLDGPQGGRPPEAPERVVLAMLLQVGFGVADHEVPSLTAVDRRWQMVLGCLGATEPIMSQGTVFAFRERARKHGFVQLLLDRTIELARSTKEFDPKRLRALIDSSPLTGAGRVEDTFNLLGRAISQLVEVVAEERGLNADILATELDISVVGASSIKAALDVDWRRPEARAQALNILVQQFERMRVWLDENVPRASVGQPPIADHIAMVRRILDQDTEPDPEGGPDGVKARRMRDGVAADRVVSLGDPEMRHGRKSKTKTFNGYKRHVVVDADVKGLIVGVQVVAANTPEHEAIAPLFEDLSNRGFAVAELHIDRGYLTAPAVTKMHADGLKVVTKPPTPARNAYYSKEDFAVDFERATITCPAGATIKLQLGKSVAFPLPTCRSCELKPKCTASRQRQISVHEQEQWYRKMAAELATPAGRASRRERTQVEHALARVGAIQGKRARFKGLEKNLFDLERVALVNNYFVLDRLLLAA